MGPADLAVGSGEFVSLLGPSGCGKSTLMLMIAGLLPPTSGEIRVDGEPVSEPRTDIGIMFQDNTLVPWRTVRGNVELQLELRGLSIASAAPRIDALLASVHLSGFEKRQPYELSGGMQQRAAFCQALVHEPRMLLLDEPLGKLDAMTREAIRSDLQALWLETKPTVVFVTHSIEEAVQLSTKVCVITPRPGRIDRVIDVDLPCPRDLEVKKSRPSRAMSPRSRRSSMAMASSDPEPMPAKRWALPWIRQALRFLASSWLFIAFFVGFFLFWEYSIDWFDIPAYILPKPSEIVARGSADLPRLIYYTYVTGFETVLGYVVAVVIAVPLGLAIAFSSILRRTIYPFFVSLEMTPKIAFAPLFISWLGFGLLPKVIIVFLVCFFPIVLNAILAFGSLERGARRASCARPAQAPCAPS